MSASRARASVQQPAAEDRLSETLRTVAADPAPANTAGRSAADIDSANARWLRGPSGRERDRVEAALAQRVNFQMEAFIAEYALGEPRDIGLMKRIGDIARSLGWRPHRKQTRDHRFFTEWRRICP